MTVYTTVPADDSNLDVVVTEANDIVKIDIQPASFTGSGGGGGSVTSVNAKIGVVVLDSDDIPEGVNKYYTDAKVQTVINTNSADFATTTYVNDQDDAVEIAANLYTDGAVTGLAATTYVNTQDGVTLSSANTYTDNAVTGLAATTYVNTQDTSTLSSANTYTDNAVAAIPGDAVTSVNTLIGAVVLDTDNIAEGANKYYTDAKVQTVINTNTNDYATTTYVDTAESDAISTSYNYTDTSIAAIPAAPVTSVNGEVGVVVLDLIPQSILATTDHLLLETTRSSKFILKRNKGDDFDVTTHIINFSDLAENQINHLDFRTENMHRFFAIDAEGSSDDGTHQTSIDIRGASNTFNSSDINGDSSPLTLKASTINFYDQYTFPIADGTLDQILKTDGSGQLAWSTGGGGGASALADLTDVSLLNLQNNDLLMYNNVATEWQNTNLGISVEPTLSGASVQSTGQVYTLTISNHASYDDPAYFVEVYDSLNNIVRYNSQTTDNQDGTISFDAPLAVGSFEIRAKTQDFGDLQSEIATKAFTTEEFGGTFRYWRTANYLGNPNNLGIKDIRLYTGAGQTGTSYPPDMTSETTPSPYVATASAYYTPSGQTYAPWKAFDSSTSTFSWFLGQGSVATAWNEIDFGSAINIKSLTVGPWHSSVPSQFDILASNTGAFTGEETVITVVVTGGSDPVTTVYNIG